MFKVSRIKAFDISNLFRVSDILWRCGKDMAQKYDLHHWDNSRFKSFVIVCLGVLKNRLYLVFDAQNQAVATFQIKKNNSDIHFEKLATLPQYAGKGVGSFCMEYIEKIAKEYGCNTVSMEVYANSKHAIEFYEHRGYEISGSVETLKYTEYKMQKKL